MNFSLTKNLSQKLRKIRNEREYSQEFIAEKLDISQKTYSNIENNRSSISIDLLERISKLYEIEVIELLGVESIDEGVINLNDKLIEQYEKRLEEKNKRLEQLEEENQFLRTQIVKVNELSSKLKH